MSHSEKKMKSGISAKSVEKSVRRAAKATAKTAAKKTSTALAIVTDRLQKAPRVAKRAGVTLRALPNRTKRFVKSHPVRVLLGASAIGFVLAKLKHLV